MANLYSRKLLKFNLLAICTLLATQCFADKGEWTSLFNGKDLNGWTPKFTGQKLGVNYLDTFQVSDGKIVVSYANYSKFDNNFGHLFYKTPYSHYRLQVEYRFTGDQAPNGPTWAYRNAGIMFHTPAPDTMREDQFFPVCVELQMLGGNGVDERSTGNICSPSSHVEIDGKLVTDHCINSSSKTFHGDQWVTMELEVHGNESVKHIVNGKVVFDYVHPILDVTDRDGKGANDSGLPVKMSSGYFALQAESHPVEYRNIRLMELTP
ncbi:DUF1080 domain-containing protein [Alteromonadaceae bacterium BrNp21-10]|nr:DUF1080 domain-containing protein [Alteromonadaceae bacterium BrNp21-10]